ncbi:hypothetical protein H8356DRAFT_1359376 [Neocallimastix lanati (nom. inval.)]|nr:hypothetical protein H8356DRAFT_1359376 [Neocallimastix sp. JGI-2020a]
MTIVQLFQVLFGIMDYYDYVNCVGDYLDYYDYVNYVEVVLLYIFHELFGLLRLFNKRIKNSHFYIV